MALVSLSEVKVYLRIDASDTSQDDFLNLLISSADAIVKKVIGDVEPWTKTEQVSVCEVNQGCWELCVLLSNIWVTQVDSINWTAYSGVLNTDYFIREPQSRKVCFKSLEGYIDYNSCYITIEYTAWLTPIPDDLKFAVLKLIWLLYNEDKGMSVKSYKVWDVSVTLADGGAETSANIASINSVLAHYETFTL